ncbi:DUF1178 family protein [Roseovarius sp. SYSU LYC5161]|uniref:DUF1178 family protein n=1 Tax=Roseovarius halophilus (ex Wu et al. 2025) TaxID=3376060 RepID=UPI00399961B3
MIQFTLKCDRDHRFDSWFQSAEAYEKLSASGMVTCSICGSTDVDKAMMAPRVQGSRAEVAETPPGPAAPTDQAVADLRREVEANSEYVGRNFVREARDMHDGLSPHRAVHGEARPDEAKKLIEDGVPVAPLPFIPGRKTN